jgi:hypothetical protein
LGKEIQGREKSIHLLQQFNETIAKEGFNENYINDLIQCIKNIRIMSINIVNYFIKIREICSYNVLGGKFDLDRINKVYLFDRNYLIKMKYDLDFLKDSYLNNYFNFSGEADPFLISVAQKDCDKYYVAINDDLLNAIKQSQFLIMQDMIFYHLNSNNFNTNKRESTAKGKKIRYVYSSRGSASPPKRLSRPQTTMNELVSLSILYLILGHNSPIYNNLFYHGDKKTVVQAKEKEEQQHQLTGENFKTFQKANRDSHSENKPTVIEHNTNNNSRPKKIIEQISYTSNKKKLDSISLEDKDNNYKEVNIKTDEFKDISDIGRAGSNNMQVFNKDSYFNDEREYKKEVIDEGEAAYDDFDKIEEEEVQNNNKLDIIKEESTVGRDGIDLGSNNNLEHSRSRRQVNNINYIEEIEEVNIDEEIKDNNNDDKNNINSNSNKDNILNSRLDLNHIYNRTGTGNSAMKPKHTKEDSMQSIKEILTTNPLNNSSTKALRSETRRNTKKETIHKKRTDKSYKGGTGSINADGLDDSVRAMYPIISFYNENIDNLIRPYADYLTNINSEQFITFKINTNLHEYIKGFNPKILIEKDKGEINSMCFLSYDTSYEFALRLVINHFSTKDYDDIESKFSKFIQFILDHFLFDELYIDLHYHNDDGKFTINTYIRDILKNKLSFKWSKLEHRHNERYQKMFIKNPKMTTSMDVRNIKKFRNMISMENITLMNYDAKENIIAYSDLEPRHAEKKINIFPVIYSLANLTLDGYNVEGAAIEEIRPDVIKKLTSDFLIDLNLNEELKEQMKSSEIELVKDYFLINEQIYGNLIQISSKSVSNITSYLNGYIYNRIEVTNYLKF